jgi:hypothetical protein
MSYEQMKRYYETHPLPSGDEENLPGPNPLHPHYKEMPNPTPEQVELDPVFNAIWQVIKSWDVNVPEYYSGYCGANGSHVMLILNALNELKGDNIHERTESTRT